MSTDRDVTRIVRSWMDEGVTQLPDRVLDAVFDQVPATPQRSASWLARRFPIMNSNFVRFALAAAAVVVIAVVGFQYLGGPNTGGPGPSETPQPTATSTASAEPSAPADGSLPVGSPHVLWDGTNGAGELGMTVTVTIPAAGWFGTPGEGVLKKNDNADAPDGAGLTVFARTNDLLDGLGDVYVYGDPCHWASTTPDSPVTTVDDAIAALSAQPSRDASAPVDVAYDGYAGKYITLHVPDDAVFADCDEGEFRTLVQGAGNSGRSHEDPGQFDLLTILDVNGQLVIFDVAYYEGAEGTPGSVLDEMAGIVTSVTLLYTP